MGSYLIQDSSPNGPRDVPARSTSTYEIVSKGFRLVRPIGVTKDRMSLAGRSPGGVLAPTVFVVDYVEPAPAERRARADCICKSTTSEPRPPAASARRLGL